MRGLEVRRLIDQQEIEDLIRARGRAADAKSPERIVACHVPGSVDHHGIFDGTIEEFAEYLREHHYGNPAYGLQRHYISNIVVDFDDNDHARVESYHLAEHELHLDDGRQLALIGGRYLDTVRRHNGRWLLLARTVVYDWSFSKRQNSRGHPPPVGAPLTDKARA